MVPGLFIFLKASLDRILLATVLTVFVFVRVLKDSAVDRGLCPVFRMDTLFRKALCRHSMPHSLPTLSLGLLTPWVLLSRPSLPRPREDHFGHLQWTYHRPWWGLGFHPPSLKDLLVDRPPGLHQPEGHQAGGASARSSCGVTVHKSKERSVHSHPALRAQSSPINFPAQRIILATKPEAEKSEEGSERHISVLFSPSQAAGDLSYIKQALATPPTSCTDENIPHPPPSSCTDVSS